MLNSLRKISNIYSYNHILVGDKLKSRSNICIEKLPLKNFRRRNEEDANTYTLDVFYKQPKILFRTRVA